MRRQPRLSDARGFTLLELLVAVAILAIIGVASYRLLSNTITTRDTVSAHDLKLVQLQKTMQIMQRDIEQVALRPVRDEFGDTQPALYMPKENILELTRAGWRNPLGEARSELVRVRYGVEDGVLKRYYWDVLDRAQDSRPKAINLMEKVTDFKVRVLDGRNLQWTATWPPLDQLKTEKNKLPMPTAVEISFSVEPYGELRRLFRVVGGSDAATSETPKP